MLIFCCKITKNIYNNGIISHKKYIFAEKLIYIDMKKDIKRLLTVVEHRLIKRINERPSKETLDHLALFAGFQDWESFRKEMHEMPEEMQDQSANVCT